MNHPLLTLLLLMVATGCSSDPYATPNIRSGAPAGPPAAAATSTADSPPAAPEPLASIGTDLQVIPWNGQHDRSHLRGCVSSGGSVTAVSPRYDLQPAGFAATMSELRRGVPGAVPDAWPMNRPDRYRFEIDYSPTPLDIRWCIDGVSFAATVLTNPPHFDRALLIPPHSCADVTTSKLQFGARCDAFSATACETGTRLEGSERRDSRGPCAEHYPNPAYRAYYTTVAAPLPHLRNKPNLEWAYITAMRFRGPATFTILDLAQDQLYEVCPYLASEPPLSFEALSRGQILTFTRASGSCFAIDAQRLTITVPAGATMDRARYRKLYATTYDGDLIRGGAEAEAATSGER